MKQTHIKLGHGSGGLLANNLIKEIVLKYFTNTKLKRLEDSAVLKRPQSTIAFTTDSYVVQPIFFPGGDIGKLAICGTVNDLAMKGAIPEYISFSMIIEEGFPIKDLEKILRSAARAARHAAVEVVCGDTKVVEKGSADRIFITTSGIGRIRLPVSKERIHVGDVIIASGTIGDHGIALINERLQLGLKSSIKSDCAPLNLLTHSLLSYRSSIHCLRDPTRGGVASVLNEVIDGTDLGIFIDEKNVPIRKEVRGASEILGIDPLYIANEGKCIMFVTRQAASKILRRMHAHPLGRQATIIGEVVRKPQGVWLKTTIGGIHPLLLLEAEGLPRIC